MKNSSRIATLVISMGALSACDPRPEAPTPGPVAPSSGLPDLVVTSVATESGTSVNSNGNVVVPIRAVVTNQGTGTADVFKVAAHYTGGAIDPSRRFQVAFSAPGSASVQYPFTSDPLAAGASVTIRGELIFNSAERDVSVALDIEADSCAGDEFMPGYCRVIETDETNNISTPIPVALP